MGNWILILRLRTRHKD